MTPDEALALVRELPALTHEAVCRLVRTKAHDLQTAERIWEAAVKVKFERKRAEFGIGGVV